MAEEKLTEDLLERLRASATPEEYLRVGDTIDRTLPEYLRGLLDARGLKWADVIRRSGLNATFAYDIFAGKGRPGRDHAIMLAFGLSCSLIEAQRLLRLAGVSELWAKDRRDAIVIWCLDRGRTREECDDTLCAPGRADPVRDRSAVGAAPSRPPSVTIPIDKHRLRGREKSDR